MEEQEVIREKTTHMTCDGCCYGGVGSFACNRPDDEEHCIDAGNNYIFIVKGE